MHRIKQLILPLILLLLFMISYNLINNRKDDINPVVSVSHISIDTIEVETINDVDTLLEFAEREMEKIIQSQNEKKLTFEETKKKFADCIRENYNLKQDTILLHDELNVKEETIDSLLKVNFDLFSSLMNKNKEIMTLSKKLNYNKTETKKLEILNNLYVNRIQYLEDSISNIYKELESNIRTKKVEKIFE